MEPISAWTAIAQTDLESGNIILVKELGAYSLKLITTINSLWIIAEWPQGGRVGFRPAFSASNRLEVTGINEHEESITIKLEAATGVFTVNIEFPDAGKPVFRYTTTAKPAIDLLIPYYPRDIMPMYKGNGKVQNTAGTIHAQQIGTRTGSMYFSIDKPKTGSVFYFQNLTALADYCQETETSAGDLVGGQWPEIGFKLPVTAKSKPLKAGKEYIISDAFVLLEDSVPEDNVQIAIRYLNNLADIYVLIPKPDTEYRDWLDIVEKGLKDLDHHKGCWKYADGRSYLNAYVSDYKSPPEIMVQLAVSYAFNRT
jgi:hypothetical protein